MVSWALFVTPFLGRCGYLIAAGDNGWAIRLDKFQLLRVLLRRK